MENYCRIMPVDVLLGSLYSYVRVFKKFELITRAQRPTFNNDHEYVDYALSILQRSFSTHLEVFPNDLEETCNGLIKSSVKSEDFRNIGNDLFKARSFLQAHNLYTLSIAYARTGSKELALAYGNRSAVLLEKQYYKECLEDIKRAFENNYPQEKKAKLILRQAKAKELLPTQKKVLFHDRIPKIKNKNPNMPSASECIKINTDEEFGRHIVANRTINPGELLLIEAPYAQFVFPESRTVHCSECLEVCYNMIPCEKCAGVLYCTKACRRKAYVDYHRYECSVLLHFGYDIINWTATRMALKGITDYDKVDTDSNIYRSDRYKEVSKLISHKNDDLDIVFKAAGVAKVFYALKKYTDIFSEFDIDDRENVLKSLLLNSACIDHSNSFPVKRCELELPIKFGRAIYSTLSMFNHACAENVGHSFYGSTIVLRAEKKIKKGEQCFINYGVNPFIDVERKRHQYIRETFHFTCKCQACVQNWPKLEMLSAEAKRLISDFGDIHNEIIFRTDIDKHRKNLLLQKTFRIVERLEPEAPFLTYVFSKGIFDKIMFEGNVYIPF